MSDVATPADEGLGVDETPGDSSPQAVSDAAEPLLIARYGALALTGQFSHSLDPPPPLGAKVVARTNRGVELGEVIGHISDQEGRGNLTAEKMKDFLEANGPDYPFSRDGKVLRLANAQDLIDQRHLESSAHEEAAYCHRVINELGLDMRLVGVEHLLGGERIVFYFSAEQRVDFRELVRRLAGQYRTRIEMRQVGARDEAKLLGDYERCGQPCCCRQFLKDLKPVTMRMAKLQKATLDPSKISGRCGRLMCCLRYEDDTYEELRQKLPRKNTCVRTAECAGRVVSTQILTQLVRLVLPDNTHVVVSNEDILSGDGEPKASGEVAGTTLVGEKPPQAPRLSEKTGAEPAEVPTAEQTIEEPPSAQEAGGKPAPDESPKPGKNRRRRKKRGPPRPKSQGQAAEAQPTGKTGAAGRPRRHKRRRGGEPPSKPKSP